MNEKTELSQWYANNPPPSMSMCATQADYWRAMYEYREAEAHQLSEEIIRLKRAASPSSKSTKEAPTDTERLDWLESWHDVPGKQHGYGDTGIALIVRTSDGFMVDEEFGGGEWDSLRQAIDAAMGVLASSSIKEDGGGGEPVWAPAKGVLSDEEWRFLEASGNPFLRCGCGSTMPCSEHYARATALSSPPSPLGDTPEGGA